MKNTAKISFLLLFSKSKRTISFICLIALLSITAGLLGNNIINKKDTLEPIEIAVVDLEQSKYSKMIFSTLLSSVDANGLVHIRKSGEEEAKKLLDDGEITAVFIIPEDFFESILSGDNKPVTASYNPYTPLQSSMIEMLMDQILEILKASQAGIYTTTDYTKEYFPEQQEKMNTAINMRYMNAVMAHNDIVKPTEVSFTGQIDSFTYYMFSMLVFLLLLGCCLYCKIISDNFPDIVITKLRKQGSSSISTVMGCTVGWWGWYCIIGAFLLIVYRIAAIKIELSFHPMLFLSIFLILIPFSALGTMLGFLFRKSAYSTSILSVYAVVSLFFSGGIIPLNYLPSNIVSIGKLFPSYWAMNSIQSGLSGEIPYKSGLVLIIFAIMFCTISSLYLKFSRKEAVV